MSEERRAARRHVLWIPVQVETGEDTQLAISRNISLSGVLVIVGASLDIGQRVTLTLSVPEAGERVLGGEIVRVDENAEDPDGLWRYKVAVAFDEDVEDLVPTFERLEKAQP